MRDVSVLLQFHMQKKKKKKKIALAYVAVIVPGFKNSYAKIG